MAIDYSKVNPNPLPSGDFEGPPPGYPLAGKAEWPMGLRTRTPGNPWYPYTQIWNLHTGKLWDVEDVLPFWNPGGHLGGTEPAIPGWIKLARSQAAGGRVGGDVFMSSAEALERSNKLMTANLEEDDAIVAAGGESIYTPAQRKHLEQFRDEVSGKIDFEKPYKEKEEMATPLRVGPMPGGPPVYKPANEPQIPPPAPAPPPATAPDAANFAGIAGQGTAQAFIPGIGSLIKTIGGGLLGGRGGPEEWTQLPANATLSDLQQASGKQGPFAYLPGFGWLYGMGGSFFKALNLKGDEQYTGAVQGLQIRDVNVSITPRPSAPVQGYGPPVPIGPVGMGAVAPHTITQRRCPKGYRLAIDGQCYPKAALPAGYRANKAKRAVVSWSEGNALRKAARAKRKLETYEKRMKKLLGTRTRTVYRDRKKSC